MGIEKLDSNKDCSKKYFKSDLKLMEDELTEVAFTTYSNFIQLADDESKVRELRNEYRLLANKFVRSNLYVFYQKYLELKPDKQDKFQPLSSSEKSLVQDIESLKLCHYTKFSSFTKMLENHQVWFSCLDEMNDSDEGKFLRDYIENVYLKNKEGYLKTNLPEQINNFYTMSFTTEVDDSSQWDRYGEHGKGVCLVSSFSKIISFFINNSKLFSFTPILYLPFSEKFEHNLSLDCILSTVTSKYRGQHVKLTQQLASWCPIVKNISFYHESEFRLICSANDVKNSGFFEKQDNKLKLNLDDYVKEILSVDEPFRAMYEKIIIGPENTSFEEQKETPLKGIDLSKLKVERSNSTLITKKENHG